MMQGAADRGAMRGVFVNAWKKHRGGLALEPLEALVVEVIEAHPEYHEWLISEAAASRDFPVDAGVVNPFLHMSMHIALREQLETDRPSGVRALYQRLRLRGGEVHALEHAMMDCLGECLWRAQRGAMQPDEQAYLACLQRLADR